MRWLPRPFDEAADPTHVTGSAIVVDGGGRVLLHRHKRLGLWLQPGGHLDPNEPPFAAARRETREETGVDAAPLSRADEILHVDVHEGGRGHLHLDLRYLLVAAPDVVLAPGPGESPDLGWFEYDRARALTDPSAADAIDAARRRIGVSGP